MINSPNREVRMTNSPRIIDIEQEKDFVFSVDSALLKELGEKLVSAVHIAMTELVKNAYDADASNVLVKIYPEDGSTRIIVSDDGIGMTAEQVKLYWMRIGTTNKKDTPFSPVYGRRKTGAKGVGRFACRRLGLNLKLTTTAKVDNASASNNHFFETTTVTFDWQKFIEGTGVDEITCVGKSITRREGTLGTTLEIWGGIGNEWTKARLEYLMRQLAALATNTGAQRENFSVDKGFNVLFETPEFSGTQINLRQEVIDAGWGTIVASVNEAGQAVCTLKSLAANHQISSKRFTSGPKFDLISGARLTIGVIPLDKKQYRNPSVLSKHSAQTIVDEWGGIHVRYNGFRMFPYGDPGDDWLGIEADRARRLGKPKDAELFDFAGKLQGVDPARSLLNMLSRKNYIGHVEVTGDIHALEPRIDRQGFLSNTGFEQLKEFVRFTVDWANINRDAFIRQHIEDDVTTAKKEVEQLLKQDISREEVIPRVTSYLRKEIKKIVQFLPEDDKRETQQSLLATIRAIETTNEANLRQLEHLRLIASASTLTLLFAHEVRTLVGTLGATSHRLKRLVPKVPSKDQPELQALSEQIGSTKKRFDDLIEMTGIVGAFDKQKELQTIHLRSAVERASRCFQLILGNYSIVVTTDLIPGDLSVGPMIEGEIYTVLVNLISNSIKSILASGRKEKNIEFSAKKIDSKVILRVLDSGVGLDEDNFEEVFKPFISDPDRSIYDQLQQLANPQDAHLFGTGSGLGLAIARDILNSRKGNIHFRVPPEPWAAFLELQLPSL
jgi:signal transduction histidine kinase